MALRLAVIHNEDFLSGQIQTTIPPKGKQLLRPDP